MIYVTVGGISSYGFLRLVKKMDEIAPSLEKKVVMQIGDTNYIPMNGIFFRYLLYEEALSYIKRANLVISHCSIGTMMSVSMFKKPVIVVPRRKLYGELGDEHQLEFAKIIDSRGIRGLRVVYEMDEIKEEILKMLENKVGLNIGTEESTKMLIKTIKTFINVCG